MLAGVCVPAGGASFYYFRIHDLVSIASELPDHQVASFIHAAEEGGVDVGESQIGHCSGKALQQRALGEAHAQDTNHRVVVRSWR